MKHNPAAFQKEIARLLKAKPMHTMTLQELKSAHAKVKASKRDIDLNRRKALECWIIRHERAIKGDTFSIHPKQSSKSNKAATNKAPPALPVAGKARRAGSQGPRDIRKGGGAKGRPAKRKRAGG